MSDVIPTEANALSLPGDLTATSWTPPPDLTYERWEDNIALLGRLNNATLFWIGDGIEFGECAYGEKYAQALEKTGKSYGRLKNITYTCRSVEKSRRRDNLSFSHHTVVAPLEPNEQDYWLDEAIENDWNDKEMDEAIHESQGLPAPASYTDSLEQSNGNLRQTVKRLETELEEARHCPHCGGRLVCDSGCEGHK